MWSFVIEKKVQRWLWYAWEPRLKRIIAHAFGYRTTETLNILLQRMENFNVAFWCTDKFSACNILPHEKQQFNTQYTLLRQNPQIFKQYQEQILSIFM